MVNYAAIGQRVKKYRTKAHLTQSELAEALDVSTGYISQIECGHTQVSLNRLDSIANRTIWRYGENRRKRQNLSTGFCNKNI